MITEDGLQLVFRILLVSAIVVAAYQVAKVVQKLVNRALVSAKLKISSLLHQMFVASARNLILIVGFMIAISQLGVSLGPLLAGLGIAGFIVGFALQDTLGISYDDDIEKAERIFAEIFDSQPQILDDPEPMIRLHELGDSSVNFVVRPWVATEDYWETYWEITKQVKLRFDQEGVSIPYPQHDIHMIAGA